MDKIIIGKHALESLTTGMYTDPLVVFREYIQNAVDSIDEAVNRKIILQEENKIEIILSPIERKIIIKDNGTGISLDEAEKTLISVGNSKKLQGQARGFRGIGRLAALSYCERLIFETSYFNEEEGTRISLDAKKLSDKLSLQELEDTSAEEVLKAVYRVERFSANKNQHYFNVILENIDPESELNQYDKVYEYLIQNAPVSYNSEKFTWGREIKQRLRNEGYEIQEYNIYLTYAKKTVQIYKPYVDKFSIDKNGNIVDQINDIELLKFVNGRGERSAFGWIAKTNYLGSIYNKNIKGIRIRKGNILIGDSQTLNVCFKDARFNGWTLGEIFVVEPLLIPNARRDNFEKNSEYFFFSEQVKCIAANIAKEIRSQSIARNKELSQAIEKTKEVEKSINGTFKGEEINPNKKGILRRRLESTKIALNSFSANNDIDLYNKQIAFEEIDMLMGKLKGVTAYKSLNSLQNISTAEKKTLEKVFDVIVSVKKEEAEEIIDSILMFFASK